MPKIRYIQEKNIRADKRNTIQTVNDIIDSYNAQGFQLTVRQIYYQFVARGLIANNLREYNKLCIAINDGRLLGLIDWNAIVDRTRGLRSVPHWTSPTAIVRDVAAGFRLDKWSTQQFRPEVWIEKDAVASVVEGVCEELQVPYFSCRGYTSQSEMWVGAMRLRRFVAKGQTPYILHFGDHDPSGKDMSRDIVERMELFMGGVKFQRMALNWDQIEQYNPPPNPAKTTDSRADAYIAEFGVESWELDALEPSVLVNLIRDNITAVRDEDAWDTIQAQEDRHRMLLSRVSNRWEDVVKFLGE